MRLFIPKSLDPEVISQLLTCLLEDYLAHEELRRVQGHCGYEITELLLSYYVNPIFEGKGSENAPSSQG